jgi:hypothetical protein
MGVLTISATHDFASGDQVTAAGLNNLIKEATFTGSADTTDNATLGLNGSNKLFVQNNAITDTQIADESSSSKLKINSSTGELTITGSAPTLTLDDEGNSGTNGGISSDATDGSVTVFSSTQDHSKVLVTTEGATRLTAGDNVVTRDAAGNTDEAGVLISGDIFVTGDIVSAADVVAFSTSDKRLKENITPISDSLIKVSKLSGNTFDWNNRVGIHKSDVGVIAQEVEALGLPQVVATREDGHLAVRYEKLIPLLIESIKELKSKVEKLENANS